VRGVRSGVPRKSSETTVTKKKQESAASGQEGRRERGSGAGGRFKRGGNEKESKKSRSSKNRRGYLGRKEEPDVSAARDESLNTGQSKGSRGAKGNAAVKSNLILSRWTDPKVEIGKCLPKPKKVSEKKSDLERKKDAYGKLGA